MSKWFDLVQSECSKVCYYQPKNQQPKFCAIFSQNSIQLRTLVQKLIHSHFTRGVWRTTYGIYFFGKRTEKFNTNLVLIFFSYSVVLQEYWPLKESGIPLKPVIGGLRIVALSTSSHEQTQ